MSDQLYNEKFFRFVQDHLNDDPALLLFRYSSSSDFDLKEAVQQIAARQKAKVKLPTWVAHSRVVFPTSISLEQSSSELTARFKARLVQGERLVDLTGGFGVDTFYMGEKFEKVLYIERQEKLKDIVAHNIKLLSDRPERYQFFSSDSLAFLQESLEQYDWLYVDPARRGGNNQKLFKLADCEPDILNHWPLLKRKAEHILVKVSPMLDIKAALNELPDVQQVLVVAVKNEVKEVLLIWRKSAEGQGPKIVALDLKAAIEQPLEFDFEEEERSKVNYALPGSFLVEPNAAILKAGGFKVFASRHGLAKLHPNTHLYTIAQFPENVPGRVFKIIQEIKLDKKELKRRLPSGKANVLVRNHPLKPEFLKKKCGLKDGGEDFLVAVTTMDGKARVYWCRRA